MDLFELPTSWVSVNIRLGNTVQSLQLLLIVSQGLVAPKKDLSIFRNGPEILSTLDNAYVQIHNEKTSFICGLVNKQMGNYEITCSHYKTLSKKQSGIYEVLGRELAEEGKDLSPRASLVSVFTSVGLLQVSFNQKKSSFFYKDMLEYFNQTKSSFKDMLE